MQRVDLVAKQRGLEVCTFLMGGWTRQGLRGQRWVQALVMKELESILGGTLEGWKNC